MARGYLARHARNSFGRRVSIPHFASLPILRPILALLVASLVAVAAYRLRALTTSGAVAAALIGACAVAAGWDWVALLLLFFLASSALSLWRHKSRQALLASIVEKGSRRDAWQVVANGAVFALAALGAVTWPRSAPWEALAAGALATATADTWATEVGTVSGGIPLDIVSGQPVQPGASGGITLAGTLASVAGAGLLALVAWRLHWSVAAGAIIAGGVAGAFADSLLGATLQERRWCDDCGRFTERRVHPCGAATRISGGVRGFDNDLVNLTSILIGAIITGWMG